MPCTIKNPANVDLSDLEPHIQGMYDFFDQKLTFKRPPVMIFDSDPNNETNVLGKTAYYDPESLEIHIYSDGRHPKDMLRSIAHELIDAELLNEETLEENQQLRWMVFKVKQKGQDSYWDKTDTQIAKRRDDSGSKQIASLNISQKSINDNLKMLNTYRYSHNWPYDYVSFVEMIKVNSEILFSDMPQLTQLRGEMQMADLSKSKVGTLKLQKMVNPVVAPFASSVLKFNPIGSLKGAKLSRAKKEFASKKARKMSKRTKKAGTAEMIPTSRKGGKKGKSRGSSGGGTGTDIMFGNNRGGNQGGGGSGGNSGGGSSY